MFSGKRIVFGVFGKETFPARTERSFGTGVVRSQDAPESVFPPSSVGNPSRSVAVIFVLLPVSFINPKFKRTRS